MYKRQDMSTVIEEDDSLGNKTVSIANTGKSPAYVRARIMVSGVAESDLLFVPKGSSMEDESKVYIEINRTDWGRVSGDTSKSGFFYYCAPLPAGSATPVSYTHLDVYKRQLMDRLYGRDERVTDPANNLKVTISNLRKRLAQAGLPGTTIQFSGGSYRWQSSLPTEVDVDCFYRQAAAALSLIHIWVLV